MKRVIVIAGLSAALAGEAYAGCELATGPCATDYWGNTYTREQNLGGGYSTFRNSEPYSTTDQNLSGGWTTTYTDGYRRNYDSNMSQYPGTRRLPGD